jgi:hypothetical protein
VGARGRDQTARARVCGNAPVRILGGVSVRIRDLGSSQSALGLYEYENGACCS